MVSLLKFNCELVSNKPNLQKGLQNLNLRSQRFILKKFCIWIIFSLSKFDRISFRWRIMAHYGEVASSLCCIRKLPDGSTCSEDVLLHVLNVTSRWFVQLFSKIFFRQSFVFPNLAYGLFLGWKCEKYRTDMWYAGLEKKSNIMKELPVLNHKTMITTKSVCELHCLEINTEKRWGWYDVQHTVMAVDNIYCKYE